MIRRYICWIAVVAALLSFAVPVFGKHVETTNVVATVNYSSDHAPHVTPTASTKSDSISALSITSTSKTPDVTNTSDSEKITSNVSKNNDFEITAETVSETTENITQETTTLAEETQPEEINSDIFEYEGREYIVPSISLNRDAHVTESGYIEQYTEVPHYFQTYYPQTRYGDSNLRKSGCGIASLAMVLTYLLDEEITPDVLAKQYFHKKVDGGSCYTLFSDSAEDYHVTYTQVWDWESVITALEEGHVVIANTKAPSVFTNGGHFIVLAGLLENGNILVRDPNLYNYSIWSNPVLKDGFANGFKEESLKYYSFPCWIYQLKDFETLTN